MPEETYSSLPSTVLAWKKANKLGRFDPDAPEQERQRLQALWDEIQARKIEVGKRCQLGVDSTRRGEIGYVGEVPQIPGLGGPWIGVALDEPSGKNNGSIDGVEYFKCAKKSGIFVRPERVEVGDFPILLDENEADLEEL